MVANAQQSARLHWNITEHILQLTFLNNTPPCQKTSLLLYLANRQVQVPLIALSHHDRAEMHVSAMTSGCSTICSDPFHLFLQTVACNNNTAKPSEKIQNVLHYQARLEHTQFNSSTKPPGLKTGTGEGAVPAAQKCDFPVNYKRSYTSTTLF